MINSEIIKIALNTKNVGLTNKYNFKSNLKSSLCGDIIKLELVVKNSKISSMKYETESCVYCEASASLLAAKVKNLKLSTVINELSMLKKVGSNKKLTFPRHFKDFKILINKNNLKRIKCINLPFDAVLKALR
ncbi:iron-sulfur cluster assembly scaffold protein [Candidatus Pelagibacter bacterium]|nr:iron-sulfur cluster assembly scaffold protein [Candidatus Pelagibacter bacterium]